MSPRVHPVANPLLLIATLASSDWKLVLYQKEYPLCHPRGCRLTGFKLVCKLTQHGCQIKVWSIASCVQILGITQHLCTSVLAQAGSLCLSVWRICFH